MFRQGKEDNLLTLCFLIAQLRSAEVVSNKLSAPSDLLQALLQEGKEDVRINFTVNICIKLDNSIIENSSLCLVHILNQVHGVM